MSKKRSRLEIIKDILEVIRSRNGKIKPTHILYKSNLSHQMMEEYLTELKTKELVHEIKTKNGKSYVVTKKGSEYLDQYKMIANFTESFGLN